MAETDKQRLFVGNLSADSTENDLKKLFKKFKVSDIEIKRKRALDGEVVFAYVNISGKRVNECLNQLRGSEWKSQRLKIEVAKESFLDRLKKERLQRDEVKVEQKPAPELCALNNHVPKNKKIKFDLNDEDHEEPCTKKSFEDEPDIPRRRNLPMFRGIGSVKDSEDVTPREPSTDHRVRKSNVEMSMKKFEDFSSVWRDDTAEDSFYFNNADHSYDSYNAAKKPPRDKAKSHQEVTNKVVEQKSLKCSSDMKRKTALEEKWNAIREKKNLVRNALKNIRSKKDDISQQNDEKLSPETTQPSRKKMTLFADSSDDDAPGPNFEVKSYLEGDEGLKRLNLKAKFAHDERFRIDERFFDADEEETTASSLKKPSVPGSIKRYDPSEHVPTKSKPTQAEKKTTTKKLNRIRLERNSEQVPTQKPEVSKEKHYSVSENLKEAFRGSDENASFSLSAMFDARVKQNRRRSIEEEEEEEYSAVPIKKHKFVKNPLENGTAFEEEEVGSDDEEPFEVLPLPVPSEKVLGKCGVWGETFFFTPDDSRLKEAACFYLPSESTKKEDFDTRRRHLRSIIKKKIQNSRRDKKVFKRKLGGKIDRTKFKMRLKRMNL